MTERPCESVRPRSLLWIALSWLVLQLGGIFRPGLLDDVDSVYLEVAREMLHRHDYVTPYVDGIRFFDKPPLMYWMAAGSMRLLGEYDWAGRLPLALAVLGLLLAVYGLGRRLYGERAGLYAALAMATGVGPYLYTRFFIPDILICLWMTLGVHLFLLVLDRAARGRKATGAALGFGVVLGLNLLTKGLIGLVFPLGFCAVYLVLTRQLRLVRAMAVAVPAFLAVALPWHLMAAMRNPAIVMPAGVGLPARAGWTWFYLYNEHVARFLGRRIPHDYGQTPVWLFWLYAAIWMFPWAAFLPAGVGLVREGLGHRVAVSVRAREAALTVSVWALLVMGFFTLSSRQEYYSLPALPAVALGLGGVLANPRWKAEVLACARWLLLPLGVLVASVCAYFAVTAPRPQPGTDLSTLLATNPDLYNVSLGHLYDLTGAAMGLFRGPLTVVAVGMLVLGLGSYLLRARGLHHAANLTLAGGMVLVLLAAHEGLVRFNPILGSKDLALAILKIQRDEPRAGDILVMDGELTSGSSVLFYTRQPLHLVNGRVNGPWFGSFWPDAPAIFEDEDSLRRLWAGERRVFLMTYAPEKRMRELGGGGVVTMIGGEALLRNR